jgi:prepilin-type N-terminal cleavage/methylation domain-containing protein
MNTAFQPVSVLRRRSGFSLVEMIGVLAIIAILAVIIVPKVFSTIASSRITSAAAATNTIKTAVTEYYGKYSTLPLTTTSANARLDDELIAKGMLESRFLVKIGTQPNNPPAAGATWNGTTWNGGASQATQSRIICSTSVPGTAPSAANGANFRLTAGSNANLPANVRVVAAVIQNCTINEARELSLRIDGDAMTPVNTTTADNAGRVAYALPNAQGLTTAYVYIAQQ